MNNTVQHVISPIWDAVCRWAPTIGAACIIFFVVGLAFDLLILSMIAHARERMGWVKTPEQVLVEDLLQAMAMSQEMFSRQIDDFNNGIIPEALKTYFEE